MFDIFAEKPLTLAEACKLLPRRRGGRPAHPSTLARWSQRGLRGVRLEVVQVGGTTCTSKPALSRFFSQLTQTRHDRVGAGAQEPQHA